MVDFLRGSPQCAALPTAAAENYCSCRIWTIFSFSYRELTHYFSHFCENAIVILASLWIFIRYNYIGFTQ